MHLSPGVVLMDRYRVDGPIGSGSQATVWRCVDRIDQTPVAIKHVGDVVAIVDEWVDDTGWYIVMPVVQGTSYPNDAHWPRVRTRVAHAAKTLAALHARGVVHADLKPDNLIVEGERVTLIDLGFAADHRAATDLSGFTMSWAAPEVLYGARATGRSDVFSLARVAVTALGAGSDEEGTLPSAGQPADDRPASTTTPQLLTREGSVGGYAL